MTAAGQVNSTSRGPRPDSMENDQWPKGWFTPEEAAAYQAEARRVRGGTVVEVGVYLGRSLSRVAPICRLNGTRLVAIDNWKGCVELGEPGTGVELLEPFRANMEWLGLWDAIDPVSGDSALSALRFAEGSVDLVFIDATHHYPAVLTDARAWWSRLRWGGVMLGHDYRAEFPGLVRAVDELFGEPDAVAGSLWKVSKAWPGRLRGC
ncbi:MAG: class I SAM-dependent methyltransferase [Phycisphaerae bacterium]|nr:class I SAM-dependent methyltransferase [Phycisphaerae bacterium]